MDLATTVPRRGLIGRRLLGLGRSDMYCRRGFGTGLGNICLSRTSIFTFGRPSVWRRARNFRGWKMWAVLARTMIVLVLLFQISYSQSLDKGSHDFPLKEARHRFVTKLVRLERMDEPPASPPPQL